MLKVYELHKDNFINERSGGYIIVYTLFNKYDRLVVNNAHSGKKNAKTASYASLRNKNITC